MNFTPLHLNLLSRTLSCVLPLEGDGEGMEVDELEKARLVFRCSGGTFLPTEKGREMLRLLCMYASENCAPVARKWAPEEPEYEYATVSGRNDQDNWCAVSSGDSYTLHILPSLGRIWVVGKRIRRLKFDLTSEWETVPEAFDASLRVTGQLTDDKGTPLDLLTQMKDLRAWTATNSGFLQPQCSILTEIRDLLLDIRAGRTSGNPHCAHRP